MNSIAENLKKIQEDVAVSQRASGQGPGGVRIIAVSKRQSIEVIEEAVAAGLRDFAENYQQEGTEKRNHFLNRDLEWHFIGSLQTNKLKSLVGTFDWIHSVDRFKVAKSIHQICEARSCSQKVLLQVNLAGEESKSGLSPDQVIDFLESVKDFSTLSWRGLMLMPPFVENPEDSRRYFKEGQQLLEKVLSATSWLQPDQFKELSMGTSQDYAVAIEEGATMIRVGEKLLGKRAQ